MCTEYESNSSAEQETTNCLDLRMHKLIAIRKEKIRKSHKKIHECTKRLRRPSIHQKSKGKYILT